MRYVATDATACQGCGAWQRKLFATCDQIISAVTETRVLCRYCIDALRRHPEIADNYADIPGVQIMELGRPRFVSDPGE